MKYVLESLVRCYSLSFPESQARPWIYTPMIPPCPLTVLYWPLSTVVAGARYFYRSVLSYLESELIHKNISESQICIFLKQDYRLPSTTMNSDSYQPSWLSLILTLYEQLL